MGFVGIIMAIVWVMVIERTEKFVLYWQSRLKAIERNEEEPVKIPIYDGAEFEEVYFDPPTFHQILILLPLIAAVGWIIVFGTGIYLWIVT